MVIDKRIIYKNDDGSISIVIPSPKWKGTIEELAAKDVPSGKDYIIVNATTINTDRAFRNAWDIDTLNMEAGIVIDLPKVKEITKNRLRLERKPLLEAQDVLFNKALETGADKTSIIAEKKRLRDITLLADLATTVDELKYTSVNN